MHGFVNQLFSFFWHLGGTGLVLLGILDSSFLFMPLGNDLLIIGLVANRPHLMPLYVVLAAFGSTLGCTIVDWIARKGGEEGLDKFVPKRRLEYVKKKVRDKAGPTLAFAALMPPPFPFTPFVAAVSASGYKRTKFYGIIFGARCLRFAIVATLAILFGRRILSWANLPAVHIALLVFVGLCVVGSILSIWTWVQRAKTKPQPAPA